MIWLHLRRSRHTKALKTEYKLPFSKWHLHLKGISFCKNISLCTRKRKVTECVELVISEKGMDLNLCYQICTFHCSFPGSPTHPTFPTKIAFTFTWKWYLKGWGEQFGGNYSVFLHMSHVNKGVYLLNFLFVFLLLFCFITGMAFSQ